MDAPNPTDPAAAPQSSASRARSLQVFERAKKCLERGDYDYAHDLFTECIVQEPGQLAYLQHFRANLTQIHPDKARKPGGWGMGGGRGAVAKAVSRGAWDDAFSTGCATLKKSPADVGVLSELAKACGELSHSECQLYYLRWALDLDQENLDLNRQAAYALEGVSQFDQAIGCWSRVLQQKPNDEEANKAVARLSVEKTIDQGGYNPALLSNQAEVEPPPLPRVADLAVRDEDDLEEENASDLSPEEYETQLREAIDAAPNEPNNYAELADFYAQQGRLQDAERLYRKSLKLSPEIDTDVLERLEDVYLRRMNERFEAAAGRVEKLGESGQRLAKQALAEANQAELEVYLARQQREPKDPAVNFELGLRFKRVGKHRDAIVPLQAALGDKKRLAETHLHLGECFQHINQHRLAIRSYESAISACDPAEWTELRKLSLYRAGVLALGLKDLETAEKHLTDLAAADFGYRDVSERLDKLAQIREDA